MKEAPDIATSLGSHFPQLTPFAELLQIGRQMLIEFERNFLSHVLVLSPKLDNKYYF